MRCQDARNMIPALSKATCSQAEREQLLQHLEQCEACSDELIRRALRTETQDQSSTADDPFVLAVMDGLPPQPEWAQPRPWLPSFVLGLSACLLLVVGVYVGWVEPPSLIRTLDRVGAQLALVGFVRELLPSWMTAALMMVPVVSSALLVHHVTR